MRRNTMALIHPIDAFGAANNDDTGFVGWANYQNTRVGFHADSGSVEVWTADGSVDMTIRTDVSPNKFLDELDNVLC